MRVLVVEDDQQMANDLVLALEGDEHEVDLAQDGVTGEDLALRRSYDVIVIDRMLPHKAGEHVVKDLRAAGVSTPVLFVSALAEIEDKIEGLKAGANDYVGKPFNKDEVLARVRALWNGRNPDQPATRLSVGPLEMDLLARTVHRDGQRIDLQPREFSLLEFLMRHAGRTVTRKMLLENVWEIHFDPQTNVIDVHISRLRSKIDREFDAPMLHTVRGSGYRLEV
jgi:two-component system OmpR family response regulator